MRETWPDVQVVYSYKSNLTVAMAGGQSTRHTKQACLGAASVPRLLAPVGIKVVMVVLPGGDDVLILGSKTLLEQLGIDVMNGLRGTALKLHEVK